jgi:hypothetical protein
MASTRWSWKTSPTNVGPILCRASVRRMHMRVGIVRKCIQPWPTESFSRALFSVHQFSCAVLVTIQKAPKMEKTFSVVEFTSESTVEVIPSGWLSEDRQSCFWPKGPALQRLLKKVDSIPEDSWDTFPVKIIFTHGKSIVINPHFQTADLIIPTMFNALGMFLISTRNDCIILTN